MIIDLKNTDYEVYKKRFTSLNVKQHLKAHVITFGCQQNEADSEKIRGILTDLGYSISSDYLDCDLIILNTCAIREHAEMKALSLLGNFKAMKKANPSLIVGVVGCMAAEPSVVEKIKNDFHYVSFTLEPNMLHLIPSLIVDFLENNNRSFVIGEDHGDIVENLPTVRCRGSRAWVSIMYGCNNFCSYCIVPYTRGRERSRSSAEVIKECEELASMGIKEITLLGQNVNSYRSDVSFAELLARIANIDGDFIIRFMTSHPKDVSNELIEVMKEYSGKVAPYFHLPLQSGSNSILKAMNRTYTRERFLSVAEKLKRSVPGIALSTDVIVGFPGETEEDFLDTVEILEKIQFDMVYCFNYSERKGTRACLMENKVDQTVKNARMKKILEIQDIISAGINKAMIGKKIRVLVESTSKKNENVYTAKTGSNKTVHFSSKRNLIGEFVEVEIEKAGVYDLFAKEI